jgi:hypothetical protein
MAHRRQHACILQNKGGKSDGDDGKNDFAVEIRDDLV